MRTKAFGLLLLISLALTPAPASAQWWREILQGKPRQAAPATECVFDHCDQPNGAGTVPATPAAPAQQTAPPPPPLPRAPQPVPSSNVAPGNFDFYVLSLSWSPGFCDTNAGASSKSQCDAGSNAGFVVHGLWPQFEHGFPADCGGDEASRTALASTRGLFPDEGLARYEWRKHGTCTGKQAEDYFGDVRRVRQSIRIPDAFAAPREQQSFAPGDILRAFGEVNPQFRAGMGAVGCTRGELQEVRFCIAKDLSGFRPCPEVAAQSCRARQIAVPPLR